MPSRFASDMESDISNDMDMAVSALRLSRQMSASARELSPMMQRMFVDLYYNLQDDRKRLASQLRANDLEPNEWFQYMTDHMTRLEKMVGAALDKASDQMAVSRWAKTVYGCGPILASAFAAYIDIERTPSVSGLWSLAGLNPEAKWEKGQKRPWNAALKVARWKLGDSFRKFHKREECTYGHLYAKRKVYEVANNDKGTYADQAVTTLRERNIKDIATRKWYGGCYPAGTTAGVLAVLFEDAARQTLERDRYLREVELAPGDGVPMLPLGRIDMRSMRYSVKRFFCFSADTDIWTSEGPKNITSLTPEDRLATLNPTTGLLEYQGATAFHAYPFQGNLLHFAARGYDLMVTPNHRLWVRRVKGNAWHFRTAEEFASGISTEQAVYHRAKDAMASGNSPGHVAAKLSLPVALVRSWAYEGKKPWGIVPGAFEFKADAAWEGEEPTTFEGFPIKPYLEFLGWWLAEGHTYKGKGPGNYVVGITQKDTSVLEYLRLIASQLGFPNGRISTKTTTPQLLISSQRFWNHLMPFGKSWEKYIPAAVRSLSPGLLDILFQAMLRGDGTKSPYGYRTYSTVSQQLAFDVAEIAWKLGYAFTLSTTDDPIYHTLYQVHLRAKRTTPLVRFQPQETPYNDNVYCVTVPNHLVFTGRNGKFVWAGNSHYWEIAYWEHYKVLPPIPYIFAAQPELHTQYVPPQGYEDILKWPRPAGTPIRPRPAKLGPEPGSENGYHQDLC